ncbi:MAG: hypothetical protein GY841_04785 [FCB group bacterium]|nr:hypothetical protein [FCB group bacterium]
MDFSSASLTRAFQKRVSLRAKEGLQVFADGNESEVVAQLTPTAEGSELSFSDAGRGVKAISISHKGLAVLGGSETDTAIFIDPINGTTTFKNSSGEAVHMPEGVDFYTNVDRYTAVKTVTIDAKGLTVLADDDSGDELVSIKSTATGPEILVSRGSGRASTGSVMINGAGLFVMNEDGTDTSMHVTNNGNILSTGQIAVGAGCSWGASRGDSAWSVVFGFNNTASGDTSTVSGGYLNTASGRLSTISGGANNNALSNTSTIGGGYQNTITTNGHASTIGGGLNNWVDSQYCVIAGGYQDSCGGMASTISGGLNNNCYGYGSAVGGGLDNSVEPNVTGGTIGGGNSNLVTDGYGTIAGGTGNEAYGGAAVGGGGSNKATGGYSAIPGGWYNVADGERSLAGGNTACALHNGAIVFSASMGASTDSLKSGAGGQFVARAASNFYLTNVGGVETAPYSGTRFINTSTGAYLTTGGVWTDNPGPTGDIRRFDGNDDILGQLENLPINKWSSKDNDKALHISPMAADFHAQFGLGEDDGSMASMDLAGVALVAVQELYQIVKKQQLLADELQQAKDELATKDQRIDALELRLTQMEAAVEMVLSQQNPTINGNDGLASTK